MAPSPSPSPLPAHYMEAPTPEPSSYASTYGTSPLAAATASESEYTSQTTHTGYSSHKSPFDSSSSNEDITSTPPSAYVSAAPGAYEMKRRPSTSSAASTTPTNGTNGKKRTPRKPVPVYTPSSSSPPPTSPPPVSPGVPSPRSPPAAGFDHDEELEERARGVLAHKNSFGLLGGEVHYLIPDMPVGAPQGR
ncbi:hypothetical protein BD779DRAFT_1572916 [Infundibulicybe gibba]|nr:hypothetical protein BD779DRAFT_1572916 [Infundibulicybe gibba]